MENYLFVESEIERRERIFFLCGVRFQNHNSDKRIVLKKYITSINRLYKVVILEENFMFRKNTKGYLAYDDIFMKNLKQVEILTALFSDFVFIIHESNSTSAELGMFATNELIAPKIILLVPDEIAIEENKINNFIRLAFFRNENTENQEIKKIIFNPSLTVWKKSKFKMDYRTYFLNNKIGENLSRNIKNIIFNKGKIKDKVIIKNNMYNKFYSDQNILSYYVEDEDINVKISSQILRIHILALFNIDDFKNNLRKSKKISEHVTYIKKIYEHILSETIQDKEGKTFNSISINIMENNININIQQAIGYFLYLLQAMEWISLQQEDESIDLRKISISMEFEEIYKEYKGFILKKENTLFGKEFESEQ